ncbi:CNPV073 hypothetical protein [Canarypox virus]|uniref:SWPV2-ORF069 n=2 Tax=Canarypox virus TaxID=44088 RepID=A0A1V0QG39_CNPV|nr:CNPV073 hypothetical protein [Canarypox virus]ARE67292.1 SWPV2-ORF069 [Shearwaterpox virus]QRM15350.1 hypothetical protein [Mudlarkpox virus]QRM15704.1 hypothetical protein [Penguinpox virus 2]QRM16035.1 hypothetical protein [Albatrosspox virus]AAR83419.1 CNPV073 hypothetical protein [Canarypox virus]
MEYNNHEDEDSVDEKYPIPDYSEEELGMELTEEEKKEQEELEKQLDEEQEELDRITKKIKEEMEEIIKKHEDAEKDTNTRDIFEGMSTSDSNKTPTQPEEPINHNSIFD